LVPRRVLAGIVGVDNQDAAIRVQDAHRIQTSGTIAK
jgi:hypothetical protein